MSDDHLSDIELLALRANLNASELAAYLKFIKAPDDFKNGQAAVIGLKRMLSIPLVTDLKVPNIDELLVINSHLEHAIATSPDLTQFNISTNTQAKKLAHGMLSDFPEYTTLFFHSQSHHNLIEQMKQLIWVESLQATDNDVSDYCRFIRVLSESHLPQFIVDRFPDQEPTAKAIYQLLYKFAESENANNSDNPHYKENMLTNAKSALRYLKVLNGDKVVRRNRTGETRAVESRRSLGVRGFANLGSQAFVKYLTVPDEDELFDQGFVRSYDDFELEQDELDEIDEQGVEPAELEKNRQLAWFMDISSPLYTQQFRAKVRQQGQVARIERHNQYLPSNIHLMNDVEAHSLLLRLESYPVENKEQAALVLIIYIMLLTCSSFERAKSFSLFFDEGDRISKIDDGIGYDLILNVWVVPRLRLPFTTTELNLPGAVGPRESIELLVHTQRVKELIERFFHPKKKLTKPLSRMHFKASKVVGLLKAFDERLTPAKVSNYLILSLASCTSVSVAGYLFNRALPGSLARYYYSSHTEYEYQKIYNDLVLSKLPQCDFDWKAYNKPVNPFSNPDYGFGARYVPSTESIREALAFMSTDLYGNWRSTQEHSFIHFHNWYTVYCIFAQSLLTGIRAVVDPFIATQQVIGATGLAIFRDKDTKDQFHTRILPLHPLALKLAEEYERHRQVILEKMLLLNPLFCRSDILVSDTTFFIDPDTKQAIEARPKEIKRNLRAFSSLPINSNRKFLRSYLEKQGLTPETIDATLGHASLGEPIGDSMSTFSFLDLKNELFKALDSLIDDVGLKLLKGLKK